MHITPPNLVYVTDCRHANVKCIHSAFGSCFWPYTRKWAERGRGGEMIVRTKKHLNLMNQTTGLTFTLELLIIANAPRFSVHFQSNFLYVHFLLCFALCFCKTVVADYLIGTRV